MAKKPTYFKERRAFLERMVTDVKKGAWSREMKFTKVLFEKYPVDFLMVVKRPFELNSLAYLTSGEGEQYLKVKLREWSYKPEIKEIKPRKTRIGKNANIKPKKTIRSFLLDE